MANESSIRAGKAFVELFADDSRLVQGLKQSEGKLREFGGNVDRLGTASGSSFNTLGSALGRIGSLAGQAMPALASAGSEMRIAGGAMHVLQGLLSGPMGWIALATGAAAAAVQLLATEKAIDYTGESVKALNQALKDMTWPEFADRMAKVGPGGEVTIWKEASAAAGQHEEAMKKLADADADKRAAVKGLAMQQEKYNTLLAEQARLQKIFRPMPVEGETIGWSASPGPFQTKAQDEAEFYLAKIKPKVKQAGEDLMDARRAETAAMIAYGTAHERERRSADEADRLALAELTKTIAENETQFLIESVQKRSTATRKFIGDLEDEAFAVRATAEELVRKRAAEVGLTAAETELAVAAVRRREADKEAKEIETRQEQSRIAGRGEISEDQKFEWKLQDAARDRAMKHAKEIADFTVRQNDESARLEIENRYDMQAKNTRNPQRLKEIENAKQRELLKLKQEQELGDLWNVAGLGDTAAEQALLKRHALQTRALALAQDVPAALRQSTAGTFNAGMVGRMGGGNQLDRIAKATEGSKKTLDEINKKPAVALAFK